MPETLMIRTLFLLTLTLSLAATASVRAQAGPAPAPPTSATADGPVAAPTGEEPVAPSSPDGPFLLPVVISTAGERGLVLAAETDEEGNPILAEAPLLRRLRWALPFLAAHDSAAALEEHESVPPVRVTSEEIAQWTATSQEAVHQLAMGDYNSARDSLLAVQQMSERAVEELNRETDRARQVLDTCLFVVRAYVETHAFTRAEQQARECRRLVPFAEPTTMFHPPEVRRALTHADALIDEAGHGSLVVRSNPSGCTVRLNGVAVGHSPYRLDDLPEGDYRVQVECDARERGRVHGVSLGPGSHTLRVDTRFDSVLRSRPFPALVYPDAASRDRYRLADAARIARAVGAPEVVLAIVERGALRLERLVIPATGNLPPARPSAEESVPADATDATLRTTLAHLEGLPAQAHLAAGQQGSDPRRSRGVSSLPHWRLISGLAATGLAIGAYALAIQQRSVRSNRGDQLALAEFTDPDYLLRVNRWTDHRLPLRAASVVGAVFGLGAAALLTPQRRESFALSIPLLAAGAGLVAASVFEVARRPACAGLATDRQRCIDRDQGVDLALLLGSLGAPLLGAGLLGVLYPTGAPSDAALALVPTRGGLRFHFSSSF